MKQENAQKKFEEARMRLSYALKFLEEVVDQKIKETLAHATKPIGDEETQALHLKLEECDLTVKNLQQEVGKLQKNIVDANKENEFLQEKNRFFADKVFKFKSQGSKLIQIVETDIAKVREIIKNEQ